MLLAVAQCSSKHQPGTCRYGESTNAGAQCGKGNRSYLQPCGFLEGAAGSTGNQLRVRNQILPHDRSMDTELSLQSSGAGSYCCPRFNRSEFHRLLFNLGSAAAFDGTGNTTTHPEVVVGSIDDCFSILVSDVAEYYFQPAVNQSPDNGITGVHTAQ